MQDYIAAYVAAYPDEELEVDDLTIRPATNGSGAWTLVHRDTGMPVESNQRRHFSLGTLNGLQEWWTQQQLLTITRKINGRQAAEQMGMNPLNEHEGYYVHPDSGLFRVDYPDGAAEPVFVPLDMSSMGASDYATPAWLNESAVLRVVLGFSAHQHEMPASDSQKPVGGRLPVPATKAHQNEHGPSDS